jgi:hypothetical protein
MSLESVVCCQVVYASDRSLVQRMPITECGVSECDREASIMRWPWPTGGFAVGEKIQFGISSFKT